MFFFFTIVISNLVFFLYWLIKMYQELQNMILKKFGKIYTFFCLCGNHKKYKDLLECTLIQEENEVLREGYMDVLKQLKELYNSGILVLNKKVLEKVRFYLRPEKVLLAGGIDPLQEQKEMDELRKKRNLRIRKDKQQQKQIMGDSHDVNVDFNGSPIKVGGGEVETDNRGKKMTSELSLSNDEEVDYDEGVPDYHSKQQAFLKQNSMFNDNLYSKMPSLAGSVASSTAPRLPLNQVTAT